MTVITNKFAGVCRTCKERVAVGEGYAVKTPESKWATYCQKCVPVKKAPETTGTSKRELTSDGRIFMPFSAAALPLLRTLPGARFQKASADGPHWEVSLDPANRARLLEVADKLKLQVATELRQIVLSEQACNANHAGLYPFQVDGVDFLAKGKKRLLADDMGLGKTVQTLVALPTTGTLAIVPASVKYNWQDEAKKWRPDLKVTVLKGRNSFRLPEDGELVVTNFDILPEYLEPVGAGPYTCGNNKCACHLKGFDKIQPCETCGQMTIPTKEWHFQTKWPDAKMAARVKEIVLVVDEVQKVKNYSIARSKRVKGLAKSVAKVIGLTGTPLENRPPDLFGVLESLQMVGEVFGTWRRFTDLMNGYKSRFGWEWGMPKPEVPELMRRVMLRRVRDKVLPDLPSKTYTTIKVDVPKSLSSELDGLWDQYGDWLTADRMEDRKLPPFEEFSSIRAKLAASRTDALIELIEEAEEDNVPLVVFCDHLAPLDEIAKRDGWSKITGSTPTEKRQDIVRRFQAGELKGVACSIRAAGIGITLTRAWKAIFIDMDWVPGNNQQAEDRICRIGQASNKVEIVRLVSNHPLDLHILDLINWKCEIIAKAINDSTVEFKAVVGEAAESEEEFELRMAAAKLLAEIQAGLSANEFNGWPAIEVDSEIPF